MQASTLRQLQHAAVIAHRSLNCRVGQPAKLLRQEVAPVRGDPIIGSIFPATPCADRRQQRNECAGLQNSWQAIACNNAFYEVESRPVLNDVVGAAAAELEDRALQLCGILTFSTALHEWRRRRRRRGNRRSKMHMSR